ncbi:hypothetical protein WA158_007885 [Blastocystis sp. Blastoise]
MSVSGALKSMMSDVGKMTSQQFQEQFDAMKVCLLLNVYQKGLFNKEKKEEVSAISQRLSKERIEKLRRIEQEMITPQMKVLFTNMKLVDEEICHMKSPNAVEGIKKGLNCTTIETPLLSDSVRENLKKKQNWVLFKQISSIPNAGNGIFVDGHINPGTILGFFPGTVYLRQHLKNKAIRDALTSVKSDYRYWYYDSSIVDSKDYFPINPLSLGHIVNHPPKDTQPNIMLCPYDIPAGMSEFAKYIPNQYIEKERFIDWVNNGHMITKSYIKTMVMIATQHIENSELFYDYCLPANARPSWYWEVDQSTKRKWDIEKKEVDTLLKEEHLE